MRSRNKLCWVIPGILFTILGSSCTDNGSVSDRAIEVDLDVLELLAQSPGHTVLSRQSVIKFGDSVQADSIQAIGFITPDERRTNKISVRVGGRIEKLYVKQLYQYVNKGDKLFDLYSPELTNAISEYLFLIQRDSTSPLTAQSKLKLQRFGLTNTQVQEFERDGTAPTTVTFYSAYSGYIILGNSNVAAADLVNNSADGMSGMNDGIAKSQETVASMEVREGSYVATGQTLFLINDAQTVIAVVNVPGTSQSFLTSGTPVTIYSELVSDQALSSEIELVEPAVQKGLHFLVARVPLANENGELKFNSLVTAKMLPIRSSMNTLPSSCVFDLGKRKIVWVKSSEIDSVSVFTPRVVITGSRSGSSIEIISGLSVGEYVALHAGVMVDRDGIISPELP